MARMNVVSETYRERENTLGSSIKVPGRELQSEGSEPGQKDAKENTEKVMLYGAS